jgi:hypothetical protein
VFGIKAGLFPLFSWLPDSYPVAPSAVTAVFAGLLTKVGVYAIIRTETLLFPDSALSTLLLVVATLTMGVGILGAIAQSDNNLAVLTEQQKNEKEGADLDASDYERIRELFQRGAVPITRLTDARRSMLLSSTRSLQTQNQIEQVKKDREDARRNLQRTSDKRQIELTQDLQNAVSKIAALRNKLEAVGDKLVYTGLVKSQLVRGKGGEPDLKISRRSATGRVRRPARDDTELLPGDVLEVTLEAELVPPLPPQTNFSNDKPTSQADQPAAVVDQRDGTRGATVAVNEPGRSPVRASPDRKPAGERGAGSGAAR